MLRRNTKWLLKVLVLCVSTIIVFILLTSWIASSPITNRLTQLKLFGKYPVLIDKNYKPVLSESQKNPSVLKSEDIQNEQLQLDSPNMLDKKDWHDLIYMKKDFKRIGLGEMGKIAELNESLRDLEKKMMRQNGFNALLSDSISVNRSVPDIRNPGCHKKKYLAKLPTVSIIFPYYNEHFSVLVRSIHSVINRSPKELLKEIILVDDFSDREYLKKQLDDYIKINFPNKVKIIRLNERTGLIGARLAGAKISTSDVLIFLDSHIEANYNWLPPLIEPIALNWRTAVCPFIDVINHDTFQYLSQDEGARGAFDWEFYYKRLPLLPEDLIDKTKPFRSPIMAGGLFAISAKFFWELGGYDSGLDIWGGEQYELSFKIWMCGGEMVDAPCSRVAHIYRGPMDSRNPRKTNFVNKNYKRVAEVWMDEYKNYLYERNPQVYNDIDPGDLSEQKLIRKKLQCKSFKWFIENIAFDLVKAYPPIEPTEYAYGVIQNIGEPFLCIDTLGKPRHSQIGLFLCAENKLQPQSNQNWALSWHRDLRLRYKDSCLDVQESIENAPIWLWECHNQGGNQYWYYDYKRKLLIHGKNGNRCIEAKPNKKEIYLNKCNDDNIYMKWNFGYVNSTALDNFFNEEL